MNQNAPQQDWVKNRRLRLYLMRHGEIESALDGRLCGHTDAKLSWAGIEQSHRLANELEAVPLAAVYTSDLGRAVFAAQLIAGTHGLTPLPIRDLREANMGDWEGRPLAEIALAQPQMVSCLFTDPSTFRYPGGESFADFRARVDAATCEIFAAHREGEIAVVAHGGVCRLIIGGLLDVPPGNLLRLSQDFGCVNVVDVFDGQPLVSLLNYIPGTGGIDSMSHWDIDSLE